MFDSKGSFIPNHIHKIFSYPSSDYYRFNLDSESKIIDSISKTFNISTEEISSSFNGFCSDIDQDQSLRNILNGPSIPFYIPRNEKSDIGSILQIDLLPKLNSSFRNSFPSSHFKIITQDKQHLSDRLLPTPESGYQAFLDQINSTDVFGFYFPAAFPGFAISAQREAFKSLLSSLNICLSGPLDIVSAVTTFPTLLINPVKYSPILCMSGVHHVDQRLEGVLKSYGPHLELWILSNLLTPGLEQVSEQWYGGLTVYRSVN